MRGYADQPLYNYCTRCGGELLEVDRAAIGDLEVPPLCLDCIREKYPHLVERMPEMAARP